MDYEVFHVRFNVMNISSIMAFANVAGGQNGANKDVYFIRCIGYHDSYLEDIRKMDLALSCRGGDGRRGYVRMEGFPQLFQDPKEAAFYANAYEAWETSGKKELMLHSFQEGKLPLAAVRSAVERTAQKFASCTPNASATMIKNFIIKLFFWTDTILPKLFHEWNERGSYKLAVCGLPKKQEYLFCYFATLLGIDVIILSPEKEPELDRTLLGLSCRLDFPQKGKLEFPVYHADMQKEIDVRAEPAVQKGAAHRVVIPPKKTRQKPSPGPVPGSPNQGFIPAETAKGEKNFEELARLALSVVMITIHDRHGEVIGTGSGIMIGAKGYILTNNHVASKGACYSVRIEEDDKIYRTDEVIKYHPLLDLALIRIDRTLMPIPLYRGNKALVRGQKVVAIGSPLGFFNSVSDGIISGFRNFDGVNMIQFTAPISHGSSGGAVLNMFGEVIGISTAGVDSGQNINLAVSYQDIMNFVRGFL